MTKFKARMLMHDDPLLAPTLTSDTDALLMEGWTPDHPTVGDEGYWRYAVPIKHDEYLDSHWLRRVEMYQGAVKHFLEDKYTEELGQTLADLVTETVGPRMILKLRLHGLKYRELQAEAARLGVGDLRRRRAELEAAVMKQVEFNDAMNRSIAASVGY